jgi:hypothetical protein
MITKDEYFSALQVVEDYHRQIKNMPKPKKEKPKEPALFQTEFERFIELFNQATAINGKVRKFTTIDTKAERQFQKLIKHGITVEKIIEVSKKIMNDSYHMKTNFKYVTPEFVTRDYNYEKFNNREQLTDSDCDEEYRRAYTQH